jgi:hypothetical protein
MWANTRSRARRLVAACAVAATVATAPAGAVSPSAAPPLPAPVARLAPEARVIGAGAFTFLGMSIYDAFYWSAARDWSIASSFALDIVYHRELDGERIAERSTKEIERLGYGSPAERERWARAMKAIFPTVGKGDRLTGVNLPERGAAFFHNGRPIGEIADPAFAQAFFGIWLDPRTSAPEFRRRLLGES